MIRRSLSSTLFPYTTLFRSGGTRPAGTPGSGWAAISSQGPPRLPARPVTWTSSSSAGTRSEEHTSELQSQSNLVCRLLLEKKNAERPPQRRGKHQDPGAYYG